MARTTASDVKILINTDLSDSNVDRFIQTANRLVDDRLSGQGLGSDLLEEIEAYLAAHFVAMREELGGLESETLGQGSNRYKGTAGQELLWTRYGQQAAAMDPTGRLKSGGQRKALFRTMPRDLDTRSNQ